MDRTKLAALGERLKIGGERLKTGGAEFGKKVGGKMKEILQGPSQEAKMVEEATADTLEEANWGLNLRICNFLSSEEFDSSEVVRAIKKKISTNNVVSQSLSLDLLETCAMNCDKVFSAVASEKLLDEMVSMIDNLETHHANRRRAMQLIEAWGKSEDLAYLPVFRQTYMSVKDKKLTSNARDDGNPTSAFSTFEPSIDEREEDLSDGYFPPTDNANAVFGYHSGTLSVEEKKEFLVITRNSIEILSSILTAETQEKLVKDDLMVSMVDKCRESEQIIQRVIESTVDDESLLFEALSLHDELQQVLSKYQELNPADPPPPNAMAVVDDSAIASPQIGASAIVSPQRGNSSDGREKEELKPLATENHDVSSDKRNLKE